MSLLAFKTNYFYLTIHRLVNKLINYSLLLCLNENSIKSVVSCIINRLIAEFFRTGVTAHTRTTTTIRGVNAEKKLNTICQECELKYTVKRRENTQLQDIEMFDSILPELGGKLQIKVYDCDEKISQEELLTDIWSSHESNYE